LSIIAGAEPRFSSPGFSESLDTIPHIAGVNNGILEFYRDGRPPRFIEEYHEYPISMKMRANYIKFDPRDPLTRELLIAHRSTHMDCETDLHEYVEYSKAENMLGFPKPSKISINLGNGLNGKSYTSEEYSYFMGDYSIYQPTEIILEKKFKDGEAPSSFLARFVKKRDGWFDETPEHAVIDHAQIKRLVGGTASIAARKLNQQGTNIDISQLKLSININSAFKTNTNAFSMWRRLQFIPWNITFKNPSDYEAKNPKHRPNNPRYNKHFYKRQEVMDRNLSISIFYHMKFMKKYEGDLNRIPCPTIEKYTMEHRFTQDVLHRFLSIRFYKTYDLLPIHLKLDDIAAIYLDWYRDNVGHNRPIAQEVIKQLRDTELTEYLHEVRQEWFLKPGYKILKKGEEPSSTDEPMIIPFETFDPSTREGYLVETPEEYADRITREWDEMNEELRNTPLTTKSDK
jgi:hypothetical protein